MEIGLQDALAYFNIGVSQWYGWNDLSAGEVYSNLKLNDETAVMPTEEEVNAKIAELQWIETRANAYPQIVEQLDKLFHDIDGGLLGEDAKTGSLYLALKEVKDNNPKPSE